MKKVLLSGLAFFAGLTASVAQSTCVKNGGFFPTQNYAADFFEKEIQYNNVYWWEQTNGPVDVKVDTLSDPDNLICKSYLAPFSYTWERSYGKISYTLTQRYGKYEPVGVGWGVVSKTDSTPIVINVKDKAKVSFSFKNTSPYAVKVRVALQDSAGNVANAYGTLGVDPVDDLPNMWQDEAIYETLVAAAGKTGDSVHIVADFNPSGANVPYGSQYEYPEDQCFAGVPSGKNGKFDPSIVSGVMFTVINQKRIDADGYKPLPLIDATFEISQFVLGDVTPCVLGIEDAALVKSSFKVKPNPATSYVEFPEAKDVRVMDAMGKTVFTAASASRIDVSSMTKGVYVLLTANGYSRFVVE